MDKRCPCSSIFLLPSLALISSSTLPGAGGSFFFQIVLEIFIFENLGPVAETGRVDLVLRGVIFFLSIEAVVLGMWVPLSLGFPGLFSRPRVFV
jgi:hypothetical protein